MAKNIIIFSLSFVIIILVGIVIVTNSPVFSQEWLIGIGVMAGGIAGMAIIAYGKIKNRF